MRGELHRLGFEPLVLQRLEKRPARFDVSFVGSVTTYHSARTRLIESIGQHSNLSWWGQGAATLPKDSILRKSHRGMAFGLEMYQALADSKISVNQHINVAENFANNMRLYEATGTGTMLVTDLKQNLHEMFEPSKEVAVYSSPEECVEVIRYYLDRPAEREKIARAGQQRTLKDHTYAVRMQELTEILCSAL